MEFAEFLAPFDAGTFRSQVFGQRPLHVHGGAAGAALLPWKRFNEVLALTPYWNEDSLKVYFKSRAALRENYCDVGDLKPGASSISHRTSISCFSIRSLARRTAVTRSRTRTTSRGSVSC